MNRRLFQINTSAGGVPKHSEPEVQVRPGEGITTDHQNDLIHHGGPRQDLLLFRLETILALQAEGHPIYPGAAGENLTLVGCRTEDLVPGRRLLLGGSVEIELTEYAPPCSKISACFFDGNFNRINQKKHPEDARIYARVLEGGTLRVGAPVEFVAPGPGGPTGEQLPDQ